MSVRPVVDPAQPTPAGHYSHAVAANGFVYVSGQLGSGAGEAETPVEQQVRAALGKVLSILAAAGCGPGDVVKVTAFLVGVEHWPVFNRVYAEVFGAHRPARSVVPVPELHHGTLVEIEAIAASPAA